MESAGLSSFGTGCDLTALRVTNLIDDPVERLEKTVEKILVDQTPDWNFRKPFHPRLGYTYPFTAIVAHSLGECNDIRDARTISERQAKEREEAGLASARKAILQETALRCGPFVRKSPTMSRCIHSTRDLFRYACLA